MFPAFSLVYIWYIIHNGKKKDKATKKSITENSGVEKNVGKKCWGKYNDNYQ